MLRSGTICPVSDLYFETISDPVPQLRLKTADREIALQPKIGLLMNALDRVMIAYSRRNHLTEAQRHAVRQIVSEIIEQLKEQPSTSQVKSSVSFLAASQEEIKRV
jgi:hypothetical protein